MTPLRKTTGCKTCGHRNRQHAEFCDGCGAGLRKGTPVVCAVCGRSFVPSPTARVGMYCGRQCRQTGISRATAERRGDVLRHRGQGKGYVKRGGRHEHRVVAEQTIGRPLNKGEIVHHKDRVKRNNDPLNLVVIASQAEHARLHNLEDRAEDAA